MTTVTISARFVSGENNFATAAEALLKGMGLRVNSTSTDNGDVFITADQSDIDLPGAKGPSVDLPPGPEITIAIPGADDIAASENPPVVPSTGEVSLKNLSSACAVPFTVDESLKCSVLRVNELSPSPSNPVSFSYCGMSFKLPAEKPGADVCNESPEYFDTSIRSMVEFVGTNSDNQPILFKLVPCSEGDSCSVVFGSDVVKLVGEIMAKSEVQPA